MKTKQTTELRGTKNVIQVNNTYERVREIILGCVDPGVLALVPEENRTKLEYIFARQTEELGIIQKQLEDFGARVHRPRLFDSARDFVTPYFTSHGQKIPLTPRDSFTVIGNTIVETASWNADAYFVTAYYRHIFNEAFYRGARWISMPTPLHDMSQVDPFNTDIPNVDPIIDGANIIQHDDTLFVSTNSSANPRGLQWLQREFGDRYNIITFGENFGGHLDTHMNILRPGLLMTFHDPSEFPDYFKNWEFVKPDTSYDRMLMMEQSLIDGRIQDDDFLNTVLVVNSLSLDQNTLMICDIYKDKEIELVRKLESLGFDLVFFPASCAHFIGNGISCLTLELIRQD